MNNNEVWNFVAEAWNAMIAASKTDAMREVKELNAGKITVNEFIAKIDENEKRVFHIFSFVMLLAFQLGLSGETEPFLSVSKSEKEYSDFIRRIMSLGFEHPQSG